MRVLAGVLIYCLALCAQPTTHKLSTDFNVDATPLQVYRALTTDWQLVEWRDAASAAIAASPGGWWRVTFADGRFEEGLITGAWPGDSLHYSIIAVDTHDVTFRFDWHGAGTRVHLKDVTRANPEDTTDGRSALAQRWEPVIDKLAAYLNSMPGAYVARPAATQPTPAVILLHDRFGVNTVVRELADSLARSGYFAVACDMFKGEVTSDLTEAARFVSLVVDSESVRAVSRAQDYLTHAPEVDKSRIALWGIGYGADIALEAAAEWPTLRSVAVWCATDVPAMDVLQRVPCPVLAVFGDRNLADPGPAATAFGQAMSQAGVRNEIVILNAAPGFADPNYGVDYDAVLAHDALARTLIYLDKRLKL
jgi:carboxymethylenebutenolidase